ncbi:MAG TPA: NnrS family protein, partial [Steroidobacteraceae bacterium]
MDAVKQPLKDRPAASAHGKWALFGYGFRPFFLASGLAGLLLIPWWAASLAWGVALGTSWPPNLWHGHEMLFGFIVAAIAGFLLTAVPSWTGARGFAGWPL